MSTTYLLAYPRSGSSLIRACIACLTGYKPLQQSGGVEPQMLELLKDVQLGDDGFYKHHYVQDGNFVVVNSKDNTLILLQRNIVENVCSLHFSMKHPKHHVVSEAQMRSFIVDGMNRRDPNLLVPIDHYKENVKFYESFYGNKIIIDYEQAVQDPTYIVTQVREVLEVPQDAEQYFLANFEALSAACLDAKVADLIRVNTYGKDTHFWRNLLGEDQVERFYTF